MPRFQLVNDENGKPMKVPTFKHNAARAQRARARIAKRKAKR